MLFTYAMSSSWFCIYFCRIAVSTMIRTDFAMMKTVLFWLVEFFVLGLYMRQNMR